MVYYQYIIRDYSRKLLKVGVFNLGRKIIVMVEVTVFRNGVKEVFEMGYRKMYIEGVNCYLRF